jgi:hypothetical protein
VKCWFFFAVRAEFLTIIYTFFGVRRGNGAFVILCKGKRPTPKGKQFSFTGQLITQTRKLVHVSRNTCRYDSNSRVTVIQMDFTSVEKCISISNTSGLDALQ